MASLRRKIIRDPVHGYIPLEATDLPIIDRPCFQRLRRVRQTGAACVYPGATHTRFEHSLGVMFLSERIFHALVDQEPFRDCAEEEKASLLRTLRCAALLHDVGHPPLSHLGERLMDREELSGAFRRELARFGLEIDPGDAPNHEVASCVVALREYGDYLKGIGVDLELFCRCILGAVDRHAGLERYVAQILNSPIDADKLDYVLRDAAMTGADLVALDRDRIISAYCAHGGWLTLSSKALSTVTGLVHGRNALYAWVYNHHAVVYTETICERYLLHLREKHPAVQQLFSLDGIVQGGSDDTDVWAVMKSWAGSDTLSRWYAHQVLGRKSLKTLWKTIFEFREVFPDSVMRDALTYRVGLLKDRPELLIAWEDDLRKQLGLDPWQLCVGWASFRPFSPETVDHIYLTVRNPRTGDVTAKSFAELFGSNLVAREYVFPVVPYVYADAAHADRVVEALKEQLR